jgi:hypothetical protein
VSQAHQTASNGRYQRLKQFCLPDLLKESEGSSSNVLVGMLLRGSVVISLQIRSYEVLCGLTKSFRMALLYGTKSRQETECGHVHFPHSPNQDHLLLQLAILIELGADSECV